MGTNLQSQNLIRASLCDIIVHSQSEMKEEICSLPRNTILIFIPLLFSFLHKPVSEDHIPHTEAILEDKIEIQKSVIYAFYQKCKKKTTTTKIQTKRQVNKCENGEADEIDDKDSSSQAAQQTIIMRKHLQKRTEGINEQHHKQMRSVEKWNRA